MKNGSLRHTLRGGLLWRGVVELLFADQAPPPWLPSVQRLDYLRLTFNRVCWHEKTITRTQRDRFSTLPTCQTCIAEVAEVTDNAASTQGINTTNLE